MSGLHSGYEENKEEEKEEKRRKEYLFKFAGTCGPWSLRSCGKMELNQPFTGLY